MLCYLTRSKLLLETYWHSFTRQLVNTKEKHTFIWRWTRSLMVVCIAIHTSQIGLPDTIPTPRPSHHHGITLARVGIGTGKISWGRLLRFLHPVTRNFRYFATRAMIWKSAPRIQPQVVVRFRITQLAFEVVLRMNISIKQVERLPSIRLCSLQSSGGVCPNVLGVHSTIS